MITVGGERVRCGNYRRRNVRSDAVSCTVPRGQGNRSLGGKDSTLMRQMPSRAPDGARSNAVTAKRLLVL